jgi:adenine specific DNA methylase Mod
MPEDLNLVNKLYYGDNLFIMREFISDECVDLIYLDPPFNSKATYNVLFQEKDGSSSPAQITAFEDTWHWDMSAESAYEELVKDGPAKLSDLVQALRSFLGTNDMMAYLTMMAVRLVEMRRVLKDTGSIYLHCDPTASHYLKLVMDAVFGFENFRNEIIWRNTNANNNAKRYGTIHQTILFYVKTKVAEFYPEAKKLPYTLEYIEKFFKDRDERGMYQADNLTGPGIRHGDSGKAWRGCDPTKVGRHWQPASYLYKKYTEITGEDLAQYPLLERLDKLVSRQLSIVG